MALQRAGLGAGALDRDDCRAAGIASTPLRSRPLAAQVRVHVATARDRLLLDTGAAVSRLFLDITNCSKLTHAARRRAHALRAEEIERRLARRRRVRRRRRQCGKRGAAPSPIADVADFVCHADRARTRTDSSSSRRPLIRHRTSPSRRSRPSRAGRGPRSFITAMPAMPAMPSHDSDPCPYTLSARAHARVRVHAHARVLPHAHTHAHAHAHSHAHAHTLGHPHAPASPP